jgi:hypothetical protein
MKVASVLYRNSVFEKEVNNDILDFEKAQLVLGFGSSESISSSQAFKDISNKFPNAQLALCSSAGEIWGTEVLDNSVTLCAMSFSSAHICASEVNINECTDSYEAGKMLIQQLSSENLKLVFVLSDGNKVNGSELVKGLNFAKTKHCLITGGLAGDGTKFQKTYVGLNKVPQEGNLLAIGFYGDNLEVANGSLGGWESFGLERIVTKSASNILFEIDHKNALDLYKKYLGQYAEELPGAALLFPLSIKVSEIAPPIVRTILSVNEEDQSMTFAGDLPIGSKVRFMRANFDRLVDAASDAANQCLAINQIHPKLAILISCVGRKAILANRIEEEVDAVFDIFGKNTSLTGFYSYGEISPLKSMTDCELHNQTMTITCINEKD